MSSEQPNARPTATGLPCPVCKVDLVMTSREGVEIDYCPTCRGVWLDRGELDKIIERSLGGGTTARDVPPAAAAYGQPDPRAASGHGQDDMGYRDDGYDSHGGHGGHGQRSGHGGHGGHGRGHGGRGSFLSRLFD